MRRFSSSPVMNKGLELKFLNKTRIFTLYVIIHFSARLDFAHFQPRDQGNDKGCES